MYIFGIDCSGPGSPLCLHHLASTVTEQQKGPIKDLVLSLRLVLSRKSFMSRTKHDPWIPEKRDRDFILLVVSLPKFLSLLSGFALGWDCECVPVRSFSHKQPHSIHGIICVDNCSPVQGRDSKLDKRTWDFFFSLLLQHYCIYFMHCCSYGAGMFQAHSLQRTICQNIMTFYMCEYFKVYEKRHFFH